MVRRAPEMNRLNHVAAVCLDLDDTLWPIGPVIARAETTLFEWLAGRYPRVTERHDIASMRRLRERVAEDHPRMRHDLTFLRREALVRHAVEAGYPESLADEGFELFFAARNEVEPFADVVPALRALQRRYRLMSLSNGNADLQRIGLAGYFEHSIGAREAGAAKPDAQIFELLLSRAGLEPRQVVYVGDDPWADVEGARNAGLQAVWLDRFGHRWPDELPPPSHRIGDLAALVELLAGP